MYAASFLSAFAYLIAAGCAVALIQRRTASWKIRLHAWLVGVIAMLKAVGLLQQAGILPAARFNFFIDSLDVFVAMLFLYAVRLLNIESRDRKRMEYQIRLVESEAQKTPEASPSWNPPPIPV